MRLVVFSWEPRSHPADAPGAERSRPCQEFARRRVKLSALEFDSAPFPSTLQPLRHLALLIPISRPSPPPYATERSIRRVQQQRIFDVRAHAAQDFECASEFGVCRQLQPRALHSVEQPGPDLVGVLAVWCAHSKDLAAVTDQVIEPLALQGSRFAQLSDPVESSPVQRPAVPPRAFQVRARGDRAACGPASWPNTAAMRGVQPEPFNTASLGNGPRPQAARTTIRMSAAERGPIRRELRVTALGGVRDRIVRCYRAVGAHFRSRARNRAVEPRPGCRPMRRNPA